MLFNLTGLGWLLVFLILLLFFQRGLHKEIHSVILLLIRRQDVSVMVFSISLLVHALLYVPFRLTRSLLSRITGLEVA